MDNYSSVITASSDRTLTEYSFDSGKNLFTLETKYPIVSLLPYNGGVAAIERWEGEFYFEAFPWKHPTSLSVLGTAKDMTVGSSTKLTVKTDGVFKEDIEWTSADPKIASVSRGGEVHAMKVGTTTVTAVNSIGLKAAYQVTVQIAERLGHESVTITERYAHLYPSVQRQMAVSLDDAFRGKEDIDNGTQKQDLQDSDGRTEAEKEEKREKP